MHVRCACGYLGELAAGEELCPACGEPVKERASFASDAVSAVRLDEGLLVTVTARSVKQVDTERLQELVFTVFTDAKWAIVDLADVEHMGSSAMSVLVRVATQRALGLVNVSSRIASTFKAMGLESFFPVHETVEAAAQALKAGSS